MRVRQTVIAGLMTGALCTVPAASFAYGPGGGEGPTPPGFGPTLTVCNTSDGGTCGGTWHGCHLKVTVPADSFAHKVTVVISKIKNTTANKHLSAGHSSVCAFGVAFFRDGHQVFVAKGRPSVNLTFTGDPIQASDHLYRLIPGGAALKNATVGLHSVTSTLRHILELAVVQG